LGNDTSSITHTSGVIASDSRSAIRCLTGSGSHGLHVPVRQTPGHRLDRLPPVVEHQPPQVTLAPPPLIPPRKRPEHIGNELRQLAPEPFHFPQPHSGKLPTISRDHST
jgi:hypothetical protein